MKFPSLKPPALVLAGQLIFVAAAAAAEPLDYSVTWVGNSFAGASNKWVQNFFIHTEVQPDGTVSTWSHWDEGGKKFGVYKDGDVIGNTNVNPNSLQTLDQQGRLWKLEVDFLDPNHQEWEFVPREITCDGESVTFPDLHQPMALALANDGFLMVADSGTGPRQQVLFYDVRNVDQPGLVRTFGDYGGIGSGTPGVITPTKFWGIRGLGMDAEDNLYVAMSEQGSVLRAFTPAGELRWELHGEFFCDVAVADPADDATTVWGIQERYRMDWSKRPGEDSKWVGYTLDRHRYPNDPRGLMHVKQQGEHGLTSPQIVYLDGRRFLFVGGMFASNFINIFRFDGEIAVPSGLIPQWGNPLYRTEQPWPPNKPAGASIWRDLNGDGEYQAEEFAPNNDRVKPGPFWVDQKGNIWMAYGFFRYDFQGLDKHGNPIYSADKITVLDPPEGVSRIARAVYFDDSDTLIVAEEVRNMRHLDRIFICRNYLAGNRTTVLFAPGAGNRLVVKDCHLWGPGEYEHKSSGRTYMPGAFVHFAPRGRHPQRPSDNWLIENLTIDRAQALYLYDFERGGWMQGQLARRLHFNNIRATNLARTTRVLGDGGRQFQLTLEDVSLASREANHDPPALATARPCPPPPCRERDLAWASTQSRARAAHPVAPAPR